MLVTAAPGIEDPAQRVADRVTEARLQRLDGEPGPEFVDLLFCQGRTLCDEHGCAPLPSAAPAI
jgi:hypothetical protein